MTVNDIKPFYTIGMGKSRRTDWKHNNTLISNALMQYYADNNSRPTNAKLAEMTGLSESSINRHFQHIDFKRVFDTEQKQLQYFAGHIVDAILMSALNGNSRSQELALQLAFGWRKPRSRKVSPLPLVERTTDASEALDIDEAIEMLTKYRNNKSQPSTL